MSLHYIIDGYNVIKHSSFRPRGNTTPTAAIISCIRNNHLCGSLKNRVTIVFDGFPTDNNPIGFTTDCEVVFSQDDTADERIKEMVAHSANPKIVIVVTDDRDIQFHVKGAGAAVTGVDEFLSSKTSSERPRQSRNDPKADLSKAQADIINEELRRLWLKD